MDFLNIAKVILPRVQLSMAAKLQEHEVGLLCPFGIGDTYFTCAFAEAISSVNKNSPIVAIVKRHQGDIPELFSDSISRKVLFDNRQTVNLGLSCSKLGQGRIFYAHPSVYFKDRKMNILGYKDLHLLDLYRFVFQLPQSVTLSSPIISQTDILSTQRRVAEYSLPLGKTVILAPDSNSTPNFAGSSANDFWQILTDRLVELGYKVVALTRRENDFLPKVERVDFPLIEAIPFVEHCGWIITARSGLCDLISSAKAKMTILYPDQKWYSGTVYNCSSLEKMGLSKQVHEIIVTDGCKAEALIEEITHYC